MLARLNFNADTLRELLGIAMPMVISQGAFAAMIFTDRYFMSQIDPVHMAAALGGGPPAMPLDVVTDCSGGEAPSLSPCRRCRWRIACGPPVT